MDSLSRRRAGRGLFAALGLGVALLLAWSIARMRTHAMEAPRLPLTDANLERSLAREAERALRERPAGTSRALAAEGFRTLAERRPALPDPAPLARRPAAVERVAPESLRGSRAAIRSAIAARVERELPANDTASRIRFAARVRDLTAARPR